jgi:hypothetical protein
VSWRNDWPVPVKHGLDWRNPENLESQQTTPSRSYANGPHRHRRHRLYGHYSVLGLIPNSAWMNAATTRLTL